MTTETESPKDTIYESNEVSAIEAGADKLEALVETLTEAGIETEEDHERATEVIAQAKKFKRNLDDSRKVLIKDAVERQRTINAEAKPIAARFDAIVAKLDKPVKAFLRKLQEAAERKQAEELERKRKRNAPQIAAAMSQLEKLKASLHHLKGSDAAQLFATFEQISKKIAEIRKLGGVVEDFKQPAAPTAVVTGSLGSKTQLGDHWTFEVVDFALVPDQYKTIATAAVNQAIQRDEVRNIPGLRIYNEGSIRSRSTS